MHVHPRHISELFALLQLKGIKVNSKEREKGGGDGTGDDCKRCRESGYERKKHTGITSDQLFITRIQKICPVRFWRSLFKSQVRCFPEHKAKWRGGGKEELVEQGRKPGP